MRTPGAKREIRNSMCKLVVWSGIILYIATAIIVAVCLAW